MQRCTDKHTSSQHSAFCRLFIANFPTLRRLTCKLREQMKNTLLINIRTCIRFTIGYSLKKYCAFLESGPVRHWKLLTSRAYLLWYLAGHVPQTQPSCLVLRGPGFNAFCVCSDEDTRYFVSLVILPCSMGHALFHLALQSSKLILKTCRLLIRFRARGIRPCTFTHILVQCLYPVIRVPLQALTCNYLHCAVQLLADFTTLGKIALDHNKIVLAFY